MGLDITAYERVELVRAVGVREHNAEGGDVEDGEDYFYSTNHPERADGLVDGVYRTSGEEVSFRAGSYGGYNEWREYLARMLGTTPEEVWGNPEPGPFVELIDFADNEGVIGPKTSAKLAGDFAEYAGRATSHADGMTDRGDAEWFLSRYDCWTRAFKLASQAGCVHFH